MTKRTDIVERLRKHALREDGTARRNASLMMEAADEILALRQNYRYRMEQIEAIEQVLGKRRGSE